MTEEIRNDEPDEEERVCNNCGRTVNLYDEEIYPLLLPIDGGERTRMYYLCRECVDAIEMV
jgi:hypothetical protein